MDKVDKVITKVIEKARRMSQQGLSEYELLRQRNIEERKAVYNAMFEAKKDLEADSKKAKKPKKSLEAQHPPGLAINSIIFCSFY